MCIACLCARVSACSFVHTLDLQALSQGGGSNVGKDIIPEIHVRDLFVELQTAFASVLEAMRVCYDASTNVYVCMCM